MTIINSIPAAQIEQWYHGNYTTEFDKWIILEKLEEFHGVAFYIGYFSDVNISFEKVDIPQKLEGFIIQRIKDLQNTLGCV